MATRKPDVVEIHTDAGVFDKYSSVELVQDLYDTSSATFEIGDDGAWQALEAIVAPGQPFQVHLNGRLQMSGRAEVNEVPIEPGSASVIQLVCRTKMADARYASADPKIRFKDTSIKAFVLAAYAPLGYTLKDFRFDAIADANLVTGKLAGAKDPIDLEPMKADALKVNPPETIFECVERVLKRHRLMHWDGADGSILVGAPNISASPLYRFLCHRVNGGLGNNVCKARRVIDWSEVASDLSVHGSSPGLDTSKQQIRGYAIDADLIAVFGKNGHFNRRVVIPADGVKTLEQARARAQREIKARAKRKNAWEIETDGWTYWNGHESIPLAINTTADLDLEIVGGSAAGKFVITALHRTLSAEQSATARVTLVEPSTLEYF